MLSSIIIRRTVKRLDLRNLSVTVTCNNLISGRNLYQSKELILPSLTSKENLTIYRHFNSKSNEEKGNVNDNINFPQLIPGPINISLSIFKLIKMSFLELFIRMITKDSEFKLRDILVATKSAASTVSIALSNKDYDSLYNLVDSNLLNILKTRIDTLTEEQRKLIAMKEESIMTFIPYDINIIGISNAEEKQRVEIALIAHYVPGFNIKQLINEGHDIKYNFAVFSKKKKFVSNYVFSRDYSIGKETYWMIKHINHCQIN